MNWTRIDTPRASLPGRDALVPSAVHQVHHLGAAGEIGAEDPLHGRRDAQAAGLANAGRRNWYPALAEDLLAAAPKLGVDRAAISDLLMRSGF